MCIDKSNRGQRSCSNWSSTACNAGLTSPVHEIPKILKNPSMSSTSLRLVKPVPEHCKQGCTSTLWTVYQCFISPTPVMAWPSSSSYSRHDWAGSHSHATPSTYCQESISDPALLCDFESSECTLLLLKLCTEIPSIYTWIHVGFFLALTIRSTKYWKSFTRICFISSGSPTLSCGRPKTYCLSW